MRKILVLVLLTALIAPMFADDAKVMPKGVLRTTLGYVYNTFDKEYDEDGDSSDVDAVKMNILGAALEMGITEQITAAAQWVPGYTFSSETERTGFENADINGFHDLFLGAKIQILGDHGFVKNDNMRFAAALGAIVPLNSYDGADAFTKLMAGDDFTAQSTSNEAFGIGARLYYDILITPDFYVNFYSQFIKYFESESTPFNGTKTDYDYKYSLDLEIEPNYTFKFNEGNKLSIATPFQFAYTPEYDVNSATLDNSDTMLFSFAPSISMFTTALVIPMDLKVQYNIPLAGKDSKASKSLAILLKLYTRLYK